MNRDNTLFLKDIKSSIKSIEKFLGTMTYDQFIADDKTSSAIIQKFEIIGEASKHIPKTIKDKYKGIPWKSMSGMRDRLVHAYFGIDFKLVWDVIKIEFPKLKVELNKAISELEKEQRKKLKKAKKK